MSYHEEANPFGVMMFVIIGAAFVTTGFIARTVGADFSIVFTSLVHSCLAVLAVVGACWLIGRSGYINLSLAGSVLLVIIWPIWWKVLDSIAAGDSDKSSFLGSFFKHKEAYDPFAAFGPPVEWYNSSLFEWSIEVGLVALLVFALWRSIR